MPNPPMKPIDINELYDDMLDMSSIINRVIEQIEELDSEEEEKCGVPIGWFFLGALTGIVMTFIILSFILK